MATKKRNPQDATLRNIRALKKRLAALEAKFAAMSALQFSGPIYGAKTLGEFFAKRGV